MHPEVSTRAMTTTSPRKRDLIIGYVGQLEKYGYAKDRLVELPMIVNTGIFHPRTLTAEQKAKYGCDIMFASNRSKPTELIIKEELFAELAPLVEEVRSTKSEERNEALNTKTPRTLSEAATAPEAASVNSTPPSSFLPLTSNIPLPLLLQLIHDHLWAQYRAEKTYTTYQALEAELCTLPDFRHWYQALSDEDRDHAIQKIFWLLNDPIYRFVVLEWIDDLISEQEARNGSKKSNHGTHGIHGKELGAIRDAPTNPSPSHLLLPTSPISLHLYGLGWENHPRFAKYARGPLAHGEELSIAYQCARFCLHLNSMEGDHQRLGEILATGSQPLCRKNTSGRKENSPALTSALRWLLERSIRLGHDNPETFLISELPSQSQRNALLDWLIFWARKVLIQSETARETQGTELVHATLLVDVVRHFLIASQNSEIRNDRGSEIKNRNDLHFLIMRTPESVQPAYCPCPMTDGKKRFNIAASIRAALLKALRGHEQNPTARQYTTILNIIRLSRIINELDQKLVPDKSRLLMIPELLNNIDAGLPIRLSIACMLSAIERIDIVDRIIRDVDIEGSMPQLTESWHFELLFTILIQTQRLKEAVKLQKKPSVPQLARLTVIKALRDSSRNDEAIALSRAIDIDLIFNELTRDWQVSLLFWSLIAESRIREALRLLTLCQAEPRFKDALESAISMITSEAFVDKFIPALLQNGEIDTVRILINHAAILKRLTTYQLQKILVTAAKLLLDNGRTNDAIGFLQGVKLEQIAQSSLLPTALAQILRTGLHALCPSVVLIKILRNSNNNIAELVAPLCLLADYHGKLTLAERVMMKHVKGAKPHNSVRFFYIWTRISRGNTLRAIPDLEALLENGHNRVAVLEQMSRVYAMENSPERAIELLYQAIDELEHSVPKTNDWIPYFNLSLLLRESDKDRAASTVAIRGSRDTSTSNLCGFMQTSINIATHNPDAWQIRNFVSNMLNHEKAIALRWSHLHGWLFLRSSCLAANIGERNLSNAIIIKYLPLCQTMPPRVRQQIQKAIRNHGSEIRSESMADSLTEAMFPNHKPTSLFRAAIRREFLII